MHLRIGYRLAYECLQAAPMVLMLNVHPSRMPDLLVPDHMTTDPDLPVRHYRDGFGNRCTRLLAPRGQIQLSTDAVVSDTGEPDTVAPDVPQCPVEELPDGSLVFLLSSHYCETDQLSDLAWSLFGTTAPGWPRVQAICDYVHEHLCFGYEHARSTRTALQAHHERLGVCRDFAHLAITFCRCMNIPARYCTGYLGNIGVPPDSAPMDFSAWFEAYLGDAWYTFDARHNTPRIGRILMAHGRDAADVAISTTFGPNKLVGFEVVTEEITLA